MSNIYSSGTVMVPGPGAAGVSETDPNAGAAAGGGAADRAASARSGWSNVWLIAKREITTKLKQRSFQIMTFILLAAIIGGMWALNHFAQTEHIFRVGVTDTEAGVAIQQIADLNGVPVEIVEDPSAIGEEFVADGRLDALVLGNPLTAVELPVLVQTSLDPQLHNLFNQLVSQSAFAREITALGGNPAIVGADLANVRVTVNSLNPPPPTDPGQMITAIATGILLYAAMMMGAQFVAQGVVEEKASRVVEVLLSTVRPWQLMAGKVIGIGIITLGQLFLLLLAGFITATATGLFALSDIRLGATLIWSAIWALIGFTTFAVIMAGLAARVSRQEEVGSVTTPALMLLMLPYVLGVSVLPHDPTNELARILSYIPPFSAMLMPLRYAMGAATTLEMLAALAISLVVLPLLVWLAGRLYAGAVLHTGGKVSLRKALNNSR